MKTISVCIPCYNVAPYVGRCLDSILKNTYQNLEIICVNDGSTDKTLEILQSYERIDSRISVIDQENSGVVVARNTALKRATGEYIAYIDSDDWIHARYFETLIKIAEQEQADVVICEFIKCDSISDDRKTDIKYLRASKMSLGDLMYDETARTRIWGRIYRKTIVRDCSVPSQMQIGEDTLFNLLAISKNNIKIFKIDTELYYYYQRADSMIHTMNHGNVSYKSACIVENIDQFPLEESKKIVLRHSMHAMLAYRYLVMFSEEDGEICQKCRKVYAAIKKNWSILSFKERLKYQTLYYNPWLYRIFRVAIDPTMLD